MTTEDPEPRMSTPPAELDEAVGQAAILLVLAVIVLLLFGDIIVESLDLITRTLVVLCVVMVVLYGVGRFLE